MTALGISGSYELRQTDAGGVAAACDEVRQGALDGVNVTMPLKGEALGAVDEASEIAAATGAVNTIYCDGEVLMGDNTDVGGIRDAWALRGIPDQAPVLVLGAGGAAAAALLACHGSELWVSARSTDSASELITTLDVDATVIGWGESVPGAVVVNATPLGMEGESLPVGLLENAVGLVDLAYGVSPTPATILATQELPTADGIDVLVAQAARSFQIWTGSAAPVQVMERAARGQTTSE